MDKTIEQIKRAHQGDKTAREARGKQGEVGLDLDVYSFVTDRVRDVKTLSGGESFLAALAMALGMAAVVVFMHRSNIGRILHGAENKFSFKSKKTIEASPDGEEK